MISDISCLCKICKAGLDESGGFNLVPCQRVYVVRRHNSTA